MPMAIRLIFRKVDQVLECQTYTLHTTNRSRQFRRRYHPVSKAINRFLMVDSTQKQTSSHLIRDKKLTFYLQEKISSTVNIQKVELYRSHRQVVFTINRCVDRLVLI